MILFRHALPTASGIVKFLRTCRSTSIRLTSAMAFAVLWTILAAFALVVALPKVHRAKALTGHSRAVPKAKEGNSVRQAS